MRNTPLSSVTLLAGIFFAAVSLSAAQEPTQIVVVNATKHAFAPPLSQVKPIPPHRVEPDALNDDDDDDRLPGHKPRAGGPIQDAVLQHPSDETSLVAPAGLAATAGLNFLGIGNGFPGYSTQAAVPDTNGAVGATQYVEFVNESFAVFNKSTGALLYGPADGNTLWQSLGAPCSTNTNLDEIAQYDKLANRWVMMMPVFQSPTYICVAVSTTSDATNGSWNLYVFQVPANRTPDYPKLTVWPDAYYLTYNQGNDLAFVGAAACALNRSAMLSGAAATMQCFRNISTTYGSFLSSDLDGLTPPPTGTPNYFANFDSNDESLDLWQFHVNWTTPSLSTFTGPTNIPVAAFNEPCGETVVELTYTTGDCIPQMGTSQGLDSYGDRLMYRLAYRNLGSYQALVVNHAVNTGTSANNIGIRWYELQNTGSGFQLYQQGTYAPDSNFRWMGSIAMDKAGDIAVGYSVSSSSMSPSIRYTGRLASDALGTMESEVDVLAAAGVTSGSQSQFFHWGDYSSLSVDPSNDCTFWYTSEYLPSTGAHWSTRIASFTFPSCTGTTTTVPWALVNKASNFGNPITNLTIPSTGTGNLIAVAILFNGSTSVSSVTDNAGNTYVSAGARATKASLSTEIWYAVSSKSGATTITPTFAGSPTHVEITEWEVSGLAAGAPDTTAIASGSVTASNTAGPVVTTTQAGDFVISALFANSSNFTAITSGSAFTDDFTTDGNGWAHLTSNSASAGTYQASWFTSAPSGSYCASTVAFLAAN